jgi:hypothetical protein
VGLSQQGETNVSIEVAFFGTLGRDAESKTSKTGKPYVRLSVRVGDGDTAQWISVMAFDRTAIEAAEKYTQGTRLLRRGKPTARPVGAAGRHEARRALGHELALPARGDRKEQAEARHRRAAEGQPIERRSHRWWRILFRRNPIRARDSMSARLIPFPKHSRSVVRVERDRGGDGWLVIHGSNGWPHFSRDTAMQDAAELADQWSATLIEEAE